MMQPEQLQLEVLRHGDVSASHATPILLVHGAWHGAWCWDHGFMERLAAHGFPVYAVSLRGHGSSQRNGQLRWQRIQDYVADVHQVVETLPAAPILVGHSMGGFVVQKYLQRYPAAGAVLLASVPHFGVWKTTLRIHRQHFLRAMRMHLTLSLFPLVDDVNMARVLFYSERMPPQSLAEYAAHLQDESYCAFLDMLLAPVRLGMVRTPMLVLGAEKDAIFLPDDVKATARAYGTRAELFPQLAHNMMLEPGWEAVAERIASWAKEQTG